VNNTLSLDFIKICLFSGGSVCDWEDTRRRRRFVIKIVYIRLLNDLRFVHTMVFNKDGIKKKTKIDDREKRYIVVLHRRYSIDT